MRQPRPSTSYPPVPSRSPGDPMPLLTQASMKATCNTQAHRKCTTHSTRTTSNAVIPNDG
eukprot:8359130-Alexandrium_andersonii.AAC.1